MKRQPAFTPSHGLYSVYTTRRDDQVLKLWHADGRIQVNRCVRFGSTATGEPTYVWETVRTFGGRS